MRRRRLTWFLLSVMLVITAICVWRMRERTAEKRGGSAQAGNLAKPVNTLPPASSASSALTNQSGFLEVVAPSASPDSNNPSRFAYRLSNTTKSLNQLARSDKAILLENALVDTGQPANLAIPDFLRAHGDPGSYIVQSRGPLTDAFRALLKQAGGSIVSYIPNNAYLVRISAGGAQQLAGVSQAVLPYEPYYKLKGSLLETAFKQSPLPQNTPLNLLIFPDAREAALAQLQNMQAQVVGEERSPFGPVIKVRAPVDSLAALAGLAGVQEIELVHVRRPANDLSRVAVGVSRNTTVSTNYLGLTGANILVNINDTGVDATHPDLVGQVSGNSPVSLLDTNGHGTHVAGSIAGTGVSSSSIGAVPSGSVTNADFRGKAPAAELFSMVADPLFGPSYSDSYLQEMAAKTNAFISNNSWNYADLQQYKPDVATYDLAAASYDAAVRDALPFVTGPQPLLFVFSAGDHGGGGDNNGLGGSADTILSPATAKNVITVGAVEQPRFITNVVIFDCTTTNIGTNFITTCQTNEPWFQMTDSGEEVAGFSSRGNVGIGIEGDFGRFKPDVVAPGTFVVSARSQQWDENSYFSLHQFQFAPSLFLGPNGTFSSQFPVPANATQVDIRVLHRRSEACCPDPFPDVPIFFGPTFPPPLVGSNHVVIPNPSPTGVSWYIRTDNTSPTQFVAFDVVADIMMPDTNIVTQTNRNLNDTIGPLYRYESGTSMSAGDVSGVLALMQQFLQEHGRTNGWGGIHGRSPALMKAMLINGAHSIGSLYDLQAASQMNFQGWGMVNLPGSLHGGLANEAAGTNSMWLLDQDPTNALATGQSHTFNISVSDAARDSDLRISLVWSDPPANPMASLKLVNDLDLVVTNLDTAGTTDFEVFFGNDIDSGNDFNLPWDTNTVPKVDFVNNVENIFIPHPLATNYSITVTGHRVNVNAVSLNPDDVVQDYALVVSCGNGSVTNAMTFAKVGGASNNVPLVTGLTNSFGSSSNYFGQTLSDQRVGANSPLLGTNTITQPDFANAQITLGVTNQWHFYSLNNTSGFPYLKFSVTNPRELSVPRMGVGVLQDTNATRPEADVDLYVSLDSGLTNLEPIAVSNALKMLGRDGTAAIYVTNTSAAMYYIGVKSEDQMAAEFTLEVKASSFPFGQDSAAGRLLYCLDQIPIPDGSPEAPGVAKCDVGSPDPSMIIRRVIVTNIISHELMGDLVGALSSPEGPYVVLNNHSPDGLVVHRVYIYDDSSEMNIPFAQHTAGPGSLSDFTGKKLSKDLSFFMEDNARNHLGTNEGLYVFLERQPPLTAGIIVTLLPGGCRDDFLEVPVCATNVTISADIVSGTGPVSIQFCSPLPENLCTSNVFGAGQTVNVNSFTDPPVKAGIWRVRLCNLGTDTVMVHLIASIDCGTPIVRSISYTNSPVTNILDDAVTCFTMNVTNHITISSLEVGLLITNLPRVSDLAVTLISPNGKRILLYEDRGGLSTNGLGTFNLNPNGSLSSGFGYVGMAPFYTNDFEASPVGFYSPGAVFQGWNVLSNSVRVVRDLNDLCLSNSVLVLGDGIVSNAFPVTNAAPYPLALSDSTTYQLTYKVSHAPYLAGMVGWWPFDQDGADIFGGHDGLLCGNPRFLLGEVGLACFGDGVFCSATVPACPDLDVGRGRGFSIEGWINPTLQTTSAPDIVYVANSGNDTIEKFTAGVGSVFASTGLSFPEGLAVDGAGNLYVANRGNNTIMKFTPGGVGSLFANTGLNGPQGLAFDSAGNLYVANISGNTIEKFTPGGVGSLFANAPQPSGLAFDAAGNLFVTTAGNTITKFTPGGVGSLFATAGNAPGGLAFDTAGNLYTGNGDDDTIERFTPGGVGSIFASTGMSGPEGVAFGSTGNLYVVNNHNNTVEVFTPGGIGSLFASSGLNVPTFVAVAPASSAVFSAAPLVEWQHVNATNGPQQGVQFWLSGLPGTNAPGSLWANIWDTNSQPHIVATVTNAITNGGWQHVALTYDSSTLTARIYTNGRLAIAQVVPGPGIVPRTSGDLYFGFHAAQRPAGTVSFAGGLDEFSLYNRALSDCEVSAIFSVTNRGKYDTNVLTCPVTNTVQLFTTPPTPPFTFVNGLTWNQTGPQWETNIINFNNVLLSATTNGPATNFTGIIVSASDPNAAVDDFVVSALLTNTLSGLMHFSEDTNVALLPIKFAPLPYILSNAPPTLVFSNGFENATQQIYAAGSTIIGSSNNAAVGQRNWTSLVGPLTVVTNDEREIFSSNWVAMAGGALQSELPTIPGRRYKLAYTLRGPGAVGWWNGDIEPLSGRARDLIGGNHGAFINGATNTVQGYAPLRRPTALDLSGMIDFTNRVATKIELGDPENLRFTNSFTIEGWIKPLQQTNADILALLASGGEESVTEQIFWRGDSRQCLDPYYLGLEQSSGNGFGLLFHIEGADSRDCGVTIEAESTVFSDQWQHVAAVFESNVAWTNNPPWPTNQMRLYVNGVRLSNFVLHPNPEPITDGFTGRRPFRDLDPEFSPGVSIGNRSRGDGSEPFRGSIDELAVYDRALTDPEITAIFDANRAGKADLAVPPAFGMAKLSVSIDNVPRDVGYGDNSAWGTHELVFSALHTNSILTLQSLEPGTILDNITLSEMPEDLTYQPEVSLNPLFGEDAFGTWHLEIWDTRAGPGGQTNLPLLVTWQLDFRLAPVNPPPIIELSHCISYTNSLAPGGIQYFVVEVPQWATMATNILEFATRFRTAIPTNVTVLFNQTNLPSPADLALIGPAVNGTNILMTNTVPPLTNGQPYYLAVTNPNPVSVTFGLHVCFDITTLANCEPATNFVWQAGIPRYFQFDVPTNPPPGSPPQAASFWLTGARSNLTVVLSQHLPLPDLSHYDYISQWPCTNDEILMVVTNTTPFPLQTNRWYVGVFDMHATATNIPFTVQACYLNDYPTIIPLTNGVPYFAVNQFAAPPGPPRWEFFEFQITNLVNAVLFELYNLTNDLDLVLQRDVPPLMAPYFEGSFREGTNSEQIVVRTSFEVPDLRGNWFLGVYNNSTNTNSFTIRAALPVNGLLVSGQPIQAVLSPLAPPRGQLLQWNAVVGESYLVEFTPSLFPSTWTTVQTVIATTPCPAVEVTQGPGYYRVTQIAGVASGQPVLRTQRWPGNRVRISWPTSFPGFALQYSSPTFSGPWVDLTGTVPPVVPPVTIEGNEFVVYEPIGPAPRYYRLFK